MCLPLSQVCHAHDKYMMTELLYYEDAYLKRCDARVLATSDDGVVLDRTVFYALGGGQPGDAGYLMLDDGSRLSIETTHRRRNDSAIVHVPVAGSDAGKLRPGDHVQACIDWDRRYAHMRIHTGLHLLSAVIPAGVTGGSIRHDSGRLDFDLPGAPPDRDEVQEKINRLVEQAHPVAPRWISADELAANPQLVKTMSVAPPGGVARVRLLDIAGVDLQACGGTHVANTAEIGPLKVLRIESKGARNRRVVIAFGETDN